MDLKLLYIDILEGDSLPLGQQRDAYLLQINFVWANGTTWRQAVTGTNVDLPSKMSYGVEICHMAISQEVHINPIRETFDSFKITATSSR